MRNYLFLLFSLLTASFLPAQDWEQRTSLNADGRHRATAVSLGNRGYFGLGHVNGISATINYSDWWEYDAASDSWTQRANYPTVNYGAVAFSANNKAYVGGGAFLSGEFYCYDPLVNTWTQVASCPDFPGDQGAFSVNNKGYVLAAGNFYEYDPAVNQWIIKQAPPVTFATWCVAFSIGASGFVKSSYSLYEYKPLYNQWVARAPFPGVNTNGSSAVVYDDRAYIVSGYVGALTNVTDEVWEYNPGNNIWTQMEDFPGTSRRFSSTFSIGDRGYFMAGTNGTNFNDLWEMVKVTGINENTGVVNVAAFPVPAEDRVTLDISSLNAQADRADVYSLHGALMGSFKSQGGNIVVERQDMAAGVYLCRVYGDDELLGQTKIIFR